MQNYMTYIDMHFSRFVEELTELLRIPSISSDSAYKNEVQRCAELVKKTLENAGLSKVEILPTEGHPVVYGERLESEKKPTVLIYGHYDVQPADPLDKWDSPPFEPRIQNNDIFGRGTADDKGQFYAHVKAIETALAIDSKLPLNIKVLIEGEEEIGSEHLTPFLIKHKDMLKADYIVISDTPMLSPECPAICYGLRGLAYAEIEVTGPKGDMHSGSFGGVLPNPANILCEIIAQLKKPNGKIAIPHFYDDVLRITKKEKALLSELPITDNEIIQSAGVKKLTGETGYPTLEKLWCRPTLDINGLVSGYIGEGAKTIIPSKALAKVSMRLVPHQQPEKILDLFEDYVRTIAPGSVTITVRRLHGALPYITPITNPALKAAQTAYKKGFDKKAVFVREGGSIGFVPSIAEILQKPCILIGLGLPDENAHAPNEKFSLVNFRHGILTFIHYYHELALLKGIAE